MSWFDNIKIRNKLILAFGALVLLMTAFAAFAVTRMIRISNDSDDLAHSFQARQVFIADAIADVYRMRFADLARGYQLADDELVGTISHTLEKYDKNAESFIANLSGFHQIALSDSNLSDAERRERLAMVNAIEDLFIRYVETVGKLKAAVARMDNEEMLLAIEEAIPIGNELSDTLQELRDNTFVTTRQKILDTSDSTGFTINIIYAITFVFIALTSFALFFTVNSINQPISALAAAVTEIADGDLTYPIRSARGDELGALSNRIGDMVNKLTEQNKTMAIMDNLDSMICVSDFDYNLLFINKHLADTYGVNREYAVTKKCYVGIRNRESPCTFCPIPELLLQKDSFPSKSFDYLWDEDLNAWITGKGSIIRWVDGSMVHFMSIMDVSQQKKQEELLEEALESANMASLAKSSFLANMSHEIRTPMNAILGVAEIQLQDESLPQTAKEALDKIYNSGDLLLSIINDILDLSKIEAGKFELAVAKYDVASLINDTVTLNMMRIGSKEIDFALSVGEDTPSALLGDELRIKQILNNLLSNAFKYTEKGQVKLSVSAEDADHDSATLVFSVSDTGQGMTDEQIARLFDEYARFNEAANRATEGTGLGMSITQNLVKMMSGEIAVKSELNWGTVFTVRLPQTTVSAGILGHELAKSLENFQMNGLKQSKKAQIVFEPMTYGSVLIVDDVETNLYVARGLMSPYGLSIDTVLSGFDAIRRIESGKTYDVIFMDHMMPRMDGIETTNRIRSLGYLRPIVALTANAVVGQAEVFLLNGFDGFISKPIDPRRMNQTLNELIRDKHNKA